MKPTQMELATLAAIIVLPDKRDDEFGDFLGEDDVTYRVYQALRLWDTCGEVLTSVTARTHTRAAKEEEERLFLANFIPGERVSLTEFLKAVMPRSKSDDREVKWGAYRAFCIKRGDEWFIRPTPTTKEELRDAKGDRIREDKSEGLHSNGLYNTRQRFLEFLEQDRRKTNKARSKSMVMGKQDKQAAKKAKAMENAAIMKKAAESAEIAAIAKKRRK